MLAARRRLTKVSSARASLPRCTMA